VFSVILNFEKFLSLATRMGIFSNILKIVVFSNFEMCESWAELFLGLVENFDVVHARVKFLH
jgi:hypothetical protein